MWADSAGGSRLGGGGGGVSSMALDISSVTSRVAFLNSLMPEPRPLANSGSFLAPNKMSTAARIRTTSQPPNIPANMIFIRESVTTADKLRPDRCLVKGEKEMELLGGASRYSRPT